jgi:AraC-like DNA-binding protein
MERVIAYMHERLGEQITVDDMARIAMFSKFHFSRVFRNSTGISPGRFLSALRLEEAKTLLVSTTMSIADVSNHVGYSSLGTFSYRFKRAVGVSPSVYRATGGLFTRELAYGEADAVGAGDATIRGEIVVSGSCLCSTVFLGLFPDALPQGRPVRCTARNGPGVYRFGKVPPGTWYILAFSFPEPETETGSSSGTTSRPDEDPTEDQGGIAVGSAGPVDIGPATSTMSTDVRLRPAGPLDPPIIFTPFDTDATTAPGPVASWRCSADHRPQGIPGRADVVTGPDGPYTAPPQVRTA